MKGVKAQLELNALCGPKTKTPAVQDLGLLLYCETEDLLHRKPTVWRNLELVDGALAGFNATGAQCHCTLL